MKAELAQKQAEYQAADKALNEAQSTLSQGKQAVAVGDKSLALGENPWHWVWMPGAGENSVALGTAARLTGITACPSAVKVRERFLTHVAAGIAKTDAVNKGNWMRSGMRIAGDKQTLKQAMDYN